ncbi:MAG: hypothetical protein KC635_14805 [Myxococcales bacterium]|nr:hypothetical protein [Myxococcales bacterium]MCB9754653.1 hypothetical protein [Myxococcales bacterium]
MAHILIYTQRTPQGIHPGSIISLCLARDIGSERGATITAVCPGDGGPHDDRVLAAAARYGADTLTFTGEGGISRLCERLRPISILVPYTKEGLAAAENLPGGPPVPRWLRESDHGWGSADPITAMIAGTLPWYDLSTELDGEYQKDVDTGPVPEWVPELDKHNNGRDGRQLQYVAPPDLDAASKATLKALGARPAPHDYVENHNGGILLWLGAEEGGLPETLAQRAPTARVLLFPGTKARFHPSWTLADWVLDGEWPQALNSLHSEMWKSVLN